MKKKGISPLIATVLILGFTVALAAVIMTWGTGFTKRMQESTEETANIQLICTTDVIFDLQSVCETAADGTYKVVIANNGNKAIKKFNLRFYKSDSDVLPVTDAFSSGIAAFGIETETMASGYTLAQEVFQLDAIPIIDVGGKEITCAQTIGKFGSVTSASAIDGCPP